MHPAASPSTAVGFHAPAELEVLVRRVLADLAVVEPITVDGPTAARIVGRCCEKTLAGYPAERTGRFKLNRRVMYRLETLKEFVKSLVSEQTATA